MDLTGDSVTEDALVQGYTAHDAAGNAVGGTNPYEKAATDAEVLTQEQLLDEIVEELAKRCVVTEPLLQARTVTPTEEVQVVTPDAGYDGLSSVTVEAAPKAVLQSKTVTPSKVQQIITPDNGYDGLSSVVVEAAQGGEGLYGWKKYSDAPDDTMMLLLHGDNLTDSSVYQRAIVNSGATVSSNQSKFGGKSLYFNGASSLTVNVPVSGNMTIECWFYIAARNVVAPTPLAYVSGNYRGLYLHAGATADGNSSFGYTLSNGSYGWANYSPTTMGVWHHVAIVRSGSKMYGFLDGVLKQTVSGVITSNDKVVLGTLTGAESDTYFNGYIDEVCVSNVAKWTSGFTPPTKQYGSEVISVVVSDDVGAYPNGAFQDGYYYEKL